MCQLMLVCVANAKCLQFCISQTESDINIQLPLHFQSLMIFCIGMPRRMWDMVEARILDVILKIPHLESSPLRSNILNDTMYKKVIWLGLELTCVWCPENTGLLPCLLDCEWRWTLKCNVSFICTWPQILVTHLGKWMIFKPCALK